MHPHPREIRVGVFVTVAIGLFIALLGVVSGASFSRERQVHQLRFDESVKGMVIGSRVNFQGVPIGAVTDIRFDQGDTMVEIEVDPSRAELQTAVTAHLDRAIVTGQVTIELEGWESGAPPLTPGAEIETVASPIRALAMDLPNLAMAATSALAAAQRVMERAETALDDRNLAALATTLNGARTVTEQLPGQLQSIDCTLRETLSGVDAALRETLDEARGTIGELRRSVARLGPSAEAAVTRLETTLVRAEGALGSIGALADAGQQLSANASRLAGEGERLLAHNQHTVRTLLVEARDAMRELRSLARQLRSAPSSLLFGLESGEIDVPARPGGGER
jgi:phospholipid/cholesterol/gamma-HCH transport system substrate-binding protein